MNKMIIIYIYILSLLILFIILLYKIIFKIKSKNFILLQNNTELRWWWWLITQTAEIKTFLWIPYKFKKHTFGELSKYTEKSFYPFSELLAKDMIFRDINYSIFQKDNLIRFKKFYTKNFKWNRLPNNWIIINFSLIENIFNVLPTINIKWFKINWKTLFRNLSHLTTDNPLWIEKRKYIIFDLWIKIIIPILIIPFLLHIIFIKLLIWQKNKNFFILNNSFNDKNIKVPYIWIEENNLIWRKNNRFIQSFIEYNLYITEKKNNIISWIWKIKIHKTLYANDSFPISWKYTSVIKAISSKDFIFEDNNYKKIIINNWWSINSVLNFKFNLKEKDLIKIIQQSWVKNIITSVNIQTKAFKYLPLTNLINKKEHWNNQIFNNNTKNIIIKYNISDDLSYLKLQSIRIMEPGKIQLNLQKEVIDINKEKTFLEYKWEKIKITDIKTAKGNKTCLFIYFNKEKIPKYIFHKEESAKINIFEIKDSSWITHYQNWRTINISWKK